MPRNAPVLWTTALLATVAAAAWSAESRRPVFTVATDLVHITVTATDKAGHFVTDLGPDDFTVAEDGKPQKVELFGRSAAPGQEETLALDLGMLFDTSESMLDELRLSQEAAVRFLDAVPRARDLLTIFFDQDIRISRYDSENQQGLLERIFETKGAGETALYDAMAAYISRVGDGPGRKVLVIYTDGEDNRSTLTQNEALQLVRGSSVTMYPIAFLNAMGRTSPRAMASRVFLQSIANATGGQLFTPRSSKDLPQIYDEILEELGAQYVLGYAPSNAKHDGRMRKLKVTVKRPGVQLRYRAGYTAPAS